MRSLLTRPLALLALATLSVTGLMAQAKPAAPAAKPAAKPAEPAKLGPGTYATFNTSKGKFVVQLYTKEAPRSVANFIALAEGKKAYKDPLTGTLSMAKLYNGLLFFRSIPGYMIQTGDPLNNGTGRLGYDIPWEKNNLKFDQPGRMSLGQIAGDPGSRGPQIFFTLKPVPALDQQGFLVMGQIVQGMDVAEALSEGPRKGGATDLPEYPNILQSVTITDVH